MVGLDHCFGKEVSQDMLTNEVAIKFDVFGLLMESMIGDNLGGTCAVCYEWSGTQKGRNPKFAKTMKPDDYTIDLSEGTRAIGSKQLYTLKYNPDT